MIPCMGVASWVHNVSSECIDASDTDTAAGLYLSSVELTIIIIPESLKGKIQHKCSARLAKEYYYDSTLLIFTITLIFNSQ